MVLFLTDPKCNAGMHEELGKKMMKPMNVICVTVTNNINGTVTYTNEQSMFPELNQRNTFKAIDMPLALALFSYKSVCD